MYRKRGGENIHLGGAGADMVLEPPGVEIHRGINTFASMLMMPLKETL
jgi:hypothetical protein